MSAEHELRLDHQQHAAALAICGEAKKVLLTAGAGSGKTRTIVTACYALAQAGQKGVLVVTFSAAAAKELVARLQGYDIKRDQVEVRTWDALACSELGLKKEELSRAFSPEAELQKQRCWTHALSGRLDLGASGSAEELEGKGPLAQAIRRLEVATARCWGQGLHPGSEEGQAHLAAQGLSPNAQKACQLVQELFREEGLLNFPHLFLLWSQNVTRRWPLVIVDEAQDNSHIQLQTAKKIADRLVLVGDASQTIHEWRAAAPEDFLAFGEEEGALKLAIQNNYRSGSMIVDFSNQIISQASWSPRPGCAACAHEGEVSWQQQLGDALQQALGGGTVAVLARSWRSLAGAEALLLAAGLQISCKNPSFTKKDVDFIYDAPAGFTLSEHWDMLSLRLPHSDPRWALLLAVRAASCSKDALLAANPKYFSGNPVEEARITLSTIHGVKGMEFDWVFLACSSGWPKKTAEDQRLFYTAATRAKQKLMLYGENDWVRELFA